MSGIFGGASSAGSIVGGRGRLASARGYGLFDDFFGDEEDVAGDSTTAVTGGTVVKDGTVIDGTTGTPAKHSQGAMPKFGTCLKPYIDDPVNPKNFCILDPKGNYTCPANQIYDPVKQGCVPYKPDLIQGAVPQTGVICPYGTKAVGAACVSLVGGGAATGGGTKLATPGPLVPDGTNALEGEGGIPTWAMLLGGFGIVAIVGGAVYAKKKSGSGGASARRR